jgi:hypothetical protein
MSDKQPMQADGQDGGTHKDEGRQDGTNEAIGTGQSDGGAYPNPHTGKDRKAQAGFMSHGGQSDIGYHGTGQLGDEAVNGEDNDNSATSKG